MPQQRRPGSDRRQIPPNRRPPRSASRRKRDRRLEAQRARTAPARSRQRVWLAGGAAAVVVLAAVLAIVLTRGRGGPGAQPTPAPTPTPPELASLAGAAGGSAVDGVTCDATPSTAHRTAVHLAIYVDGAARQVPPGIGVGPPLQTAATDAGPFVSGACYYWLNTRTGDGIVHVQPPAAATYTLGTLFDIWGQPLTATSAGPATGAVTVLVNGSRYSGDPRAVQLTQHAVIQINVGAAVPFKSYTFPAGE
ncbi:MAG TPA: hypothetical protein VF155_02255 [Candidatus Dormibacteraeota bacterium]